MSLLLFIKGCSKFWKSFKISLILLINLSSISERVNIRPSLNQVSDTYNYGKVKQSFIFDVIIIMNILFDQMNALDKKDKVEDNLFVKNIIVNKEKSKKQFVPFIATEKWIGQLGDRLQMNT